jgi:hypothetical protein
VLRVAQPFKQLAGQASQPFAAAFFPNPALQVSITFASALVHASTLVATRPPLVSHAVVQVSGLFPSKTLPFLHFVQTVPLVVQVLQSVGQDLQTPASSQ